MARVITYFIPSSNLGDPKKPDYDSSTISSVIADEQTNVPTLPLVAALLSVLIQPFAKEVTGHQVLRQMILILHPLCLLLEFWLHHLNNP
jgi:hypothetical protein